MEDVDRFDHKKRIGKATMFQCVCVYVYVRIKASIRNFHVAHKFELWTKSSWNITWKKHDECLLTKSRWRYNIYFLLLSICLLLFSILFVLIAVISSSLYLVATVPCCFRCSLFFWLFASMAIFLADKKIRRFTLEMWILWHVA